MGGLINKTLYTTLFLETRVDHNHTVRDPNVDIKAITGPSVAYHPEGLNHTLLSHGCISKMAPAMITVGRKCFEGQESGQGA